MEQTVLGRTGLRVSVAGLGSGGDSRLGAATDPAAAARVLTRAFELGVTYYDTAQTYGTEELIGRTLRSHRDEIVLASKFVPRHRDGSLLSCAELRHELKESLRRLQTDRIDVYHVHSPSLAEYAYCRSELLPELYELRDRGVIRFLALSEGVTADPGHEMLGQALEDDCWDVMLSAFSLFNQTARDSLLPTAQKHDVGIVVMTAVRAPLNSRSGLLAATGKLAADGSIALDPRRAGEVVGALLGEDGDDGQAARFGYRLARHEPGVDVVLVGTGSLDHLERNIASINGPPLSPEARELAAAVYGRLAIGRYT